MLLKMATTHREIEMPQSVIRVVPWAVSRGLVEEHPQIAVPRTGHTETVRGTHTTLRIEAVTGTSTHLTLKTKGEWEGNLVAVALTPRSKSGERIPGHTIVRVVPLACDELPSSPEEDTAYARLVLGKIATHADIYLPVRRLLKAHMWNKVALGLLMTSLRESLAAGFDSRHWKESLVRYGLLPEDVLLTPEPTPTIEDRLTFMQQVVAPKRFSRLS